MGISSPDLSKTGKKVICECFMVNFTLYKKKRTIYPKFSVFSIWS